MVHALELIFGLNLIKKIGCNWTIQFQLTIENQFLYWIQRCEWGLQIIETIFINKQTTLFYIYIFKKKNLLYIITPYNLVS